MLPRGERLTRKRDFALVYGRKKSLATPLLVLYVRRYSQNEVRAAETRRMGFVVSKKVSKKAHDRNRIKRRLREICRAGGRNWQAGFDAVFVVRSQAAAATFAELQTTVAGLIRRAGLEGRNEQ